MRARHTFSSGSGISRSIVRVRVPVDAYGDAGDQVMHFCAIRTLRAGLKPDGNAESVAPRWSMNSCSGGAAELHEKAVERDLLLDVAAEEGGDFVDAFDRFDQPGA